MIAAVALERGYRLAHLASIGSTNQEALERARSGEDGPIWVVADVQTRGRGRSGRDWCSPGGNLYATLLLVDPCEARVMPQLGFVAGVALARALWAIAGPDCGLALKWPNDMLCRGAKLAGILVEAISGPTGVLSAVLGFGVNCRSHPSDLAYPATHLTAAIGAGGTRDLLFSTLSASVPEVLDLWDRGAGFAAIRAEWLTYALPVGSALAVTRPDGRYRGKFKTVDPDGRLILETNSGVLTVEAGDVFLADHDMTAAS